METNDSNTGSGKLNWLKRVQEQSWEPEILISGIVLFALLQLPPYIRDLGRFLDTYSVTLFSLGNTDRTLIVVLLTANYWLVAGFTAHLIFRSVWVAFVGLSYVYRNGVDSSQLHYRSSYLKLLERNTNYEANISRLEKICSTVFAVSFLFFMCMIGAFFFLSVLVLIIGLTFEYAPGLINPVEGYIDSFISIVSLIYLFDFVTLGLLKRIPVVSRIYYPFYRVMGFLTLAPLYRNIYYGFVSNHKKWKVGIFILAFVGMSFLIMRSIKAEKGLFNTMELQIESSDEYIQYHGHYDNLMGDDPSKRLHIQSDVIEGNVLRAFIVHTTAYEEELILGRCAYLEHSVDNDTDRDSLKLQCLSSFYSLELDGKPVPANYLYHEKQSTGQVGLLSYMDVSDLPRGMHKLNLLYNFKDTTRTFAQVEFYKSTAGKWHTDTNNATNYGGPH